LVADFRAVYPLVRFDLEPILDERLTPRLPAATDFEITTARREGPNVQWRPLLVEPLALAVAPGHRLEHAERVELREVADEPFVMLRQTYALRRTCDELCRAAGFEPTVVLEADDAETMAGFVQARLGVAIIPAGGHFLAPDDRTNPLAARWIPLRDKGASRVVGVAWSGGRRLLPSAANFLESALTTARRLPRPTTESAGGP
jgi:DNA-binding transcriptional LysR family regulator